MARVLVVVAVAVWGLGGGISVASGGVKYTKCSHVCKALVAHCILREISKILINEFLQGVQYVHHQHVIRGEQLAVNFIRNPI
jgi:hypothetical protein